MVFKALGGLFGSKKPAIKTTADYARWREVIFAVKPEQVDVSAEATDQVYGVLLDVGLLDRATASPWAVSLSAFPTGEASFRPTVGGGAIGLGSNAEVSSLAQEIVTLAQGSVGQTAPAQDHELPEPGIAQVFLLTPGGLRRSVGPVEQMQRPDQPFGPLLERFGRIQHLADTLTAAPASQTTAGAVKAVYMLTFTPQKMAADALQGLTRAAMDMLRAKDATFERLLAEQVGPKTGIEIANVEYAPLMHTPQTMQNAMQGWLKNQYGLTFNPIIGQTFFPHGMRDSQDKENFVLFYFDIAGS